MYLKDISFRRKIISQELAGLSYFNVDCDVKSFAKDPALISTLLVDGLTNEQVIQLVLRSEISHVIQNSFESIESKIKLIQRLDKNYMGFYDSKFTILEKPEEMQEFTFLRSENREIVLDKVSVFLKIDRLKTRHFNLISVLNEMIMNAQAVSMSLKSTINFPSIIRLVVEKSKDLVVFSVFDNAGILNFDKFFKKIEQTQELGYRQSINFGHGGAGIGTSIIFNNSDSIFLSCMPNQLTRVSAVIPFNKSEEELTLGQKSIHLIRNLVKVKGTIYV